MIEITTGVVFLMSSLYGSGQTSSVSIPVDNGKETNVSTIQSSSFTNSKAVEAYVRAAYVNEPILVDIARCESTFRQFGPDGQVIRGKVNPADVGVMQINEKYHSNEATNKNIDIYTLEGNVAFAKVLYNKFGTEPWSASEKCWGDLARR